MTRIDALSLAAALGLGACTIHHVTPYVPDYANAPQTADAAEASANCFEASTAAETAICAAPALKDANRAMIQALQGQLRTASIFGRDALLASQRAWLLSLPGTCHLPQPPAAAPSGAGACLATALDARSTELHAWTAAPVIPEGAIAQYVGLRPAAGAAAQPEPAFCAGFAQRGEAALRRSGALDPAIMGYEEVAGSHGVAAAPPIAVDLYDANVYGLFQRRARSVSIGGAAPVITPTSLTRLVGVLSTANQGGRFSGFASQTGDYGAIDVFRTAPAGGRLLVLAEDAWGWTTPASPGEAAHAGLWELGSGAPAPVCLFDTYTRPSEQGAFEALANVSAWRGVLAQIAASASVPLGAAPLRDQALLGADADFVVLHMPLLAIEQAGAPGQTLWLRERHDDVLDALFAWSAASPANKVLFDRLFALLRPAASELVHAYQTSQALDAREATQAGGLAVMELLYQATVTIAPGLGASPEPRAGYRPRYPILAAPQ